MSRYHSGTNNHAWRLMDSEWLTSVYSHPKTHPAQTGLVWFILLSCILSLALFLSYPLIRSVSSLTPPRAFSTNFVSQHRITWRRTTPPSWFTWRTSTIIRPFSSGQRTGRRLPRRTIGTFRSVCCRSNMQFGSNPSILPFFRICSVHPPPFHLLPSTQHFKFVYLVFVTLWSCHTFIRLLPMSYVLWVQLLLGLKRTHLACIYCYSSQYGMVS